MQGGVGRTLFRQQQLLIAGTNVNTTSETKRKYHYLAKINTVQFESCKLRSCQPRLGSSRWWYAHKARYRGHGEQLVYHRHACSFSDFWIKRFANVGDKSHPLTTFSRGLDSCNHVSAACHFVLFVSINLHFTKQVPLGAYFNIINL